MEKKQQKLSLRKKLPHVLTLNKNLVIVLAGIGLLLLLIAVISALQSKKSSTAATPALQVTNTHTQISNRINQLPDYSDATAIKKLLNENPKSNNNSKESPEVLAELNRFQAEQNQLKAELTSLRQQKENTPPMPHFTQEDKTAFSSSLFFAHGQPPQSSLNRGIDTSESNEINQNKNDEKNDKADQNLQQEKLDFLESGSSTDTLNKNPMKKLPSPYTIFEGTYIPATLDNNINSDLPGNVIAKVRANVYDSVTGTHLLIPVGSTLVGQYNSQVAYGQSRVQIVFTRLIRPDGSSIVLSKSQGVGDGGDSGVSGAVNNHWGRIIGSALLTAAFSLPEAFINTTNPSTIVINGSDGTQGSIGNSAASAGIQSGVNTASQIGSNIASRSLNQQPTIQIEGGKLFTVMVQKDMIIPPYEEEVAK